MTVNSLPITNVINVTIEQTPTGLAIPNVNNVLLLTTESPANLEVFGDYFSAAQVAANYGTNSVTAAMANNLFAQTPNPLTGTGQLIIAPFSPTNPAVSATNGTFTTPSIIANLAAFIAVTNGDLSVTCDGGTAQHLANLNFSLCVTLADVAAVLDAAVINCNVTATSTTIIFTSNKVGSTSAIALATYAGGGTDLTGTTLLHTATGTAAGGAASSGETIATAIARILPQAFFASVMTNLNLDDTAISAAASAVQAQDMLFFHHIASSTDIAGIATTVQQATQQKTRLLPYLQGQTAANLYKAAYVGRGISQDQTGSDTSFTMHQKQLVNVTPDTGITQTLLVACQAAGCDPYVSIMGYPMVFSTGGNDYFDNQYSNLAIKFAMEIAGFNYLAGTNTKVPQTEQGMNGLKAAYIQICEQFVVNGELAPGAWNSSQTFGDPQTFLNNIASTGYYVYSQPVAQQSAAARNARQAPLVQIALKRAGAIQSSNVIVLINN